MIINCFKFIEGGWHGLFFLTKVIETANNFSPQVGMKLMGGDGFYCNVDKVEYNYSKNQYNVYEKNYNCYRDGGLPPEGVPCMVAKITMQEFHDRGWNIWHRPPPHYSE